MKKFILFLILNLFGIFFQSHSQSNPVVLKPGFTISRLLTVKNGVIRIERDEIDNKLYYILTSGEIYQVIQPAVGLPYDSLVCSVTQHGVQYVQGMTFHDSTWYIGGNNFSTTPLTYGIIVRGKLQQNGSRTWDTLMHTVRYKTCDAFDHLFSGLVLNPAADSIYICSGARGDHGEVASRYGLYPGVRNLPLTSNTYILPTHNLATITLQNDSAWLDTSGFLFARGTRNHFDMAFDQHGNLFGLENSGDRDHNEELNWLRAGKHYGFPWVMGDTYNPQQYANFNPATDKLINHNCRSWRLNAWSNDTAYPQIPPGLTFEAPIQNFGPDCDKYRDTLGNVHDASDEGISMGTFTAHRSPLGLVFDNSNVLGPLYKGDAFMFSWTEGYDSTGSPPLPDSTHIGPFSDPSQDMVHLDLAYDSASAKFSLHATRVIAEFLNPVDAEIDSNVIYVIENGYDNLRGLYVIHPPVATYPCSPVANVTTVNPCVPDTNTVSIESFGALPNYISWYDNSGLLLKTDTGLTAADSIFNLPSGAYYALTIDGGACGTDSVSFSISEPISLIVDSVKNTSCIGCFDGEIYYTVLNATGPVTFLPNPSQLAAGVYTFCVTDQNGCTACQPTVILDDPTGISNSIAEKSISVFPNPVINEAKLISKEKIIGVKVINSKGSMVDISFRKTSDNEVILNTQNLSNGYYQVQITTELNIRYKKLIIVK